MDNYPFKRDFYYDLVISATNNKATFLLGPRKCGKTVSLKQAEKHFANAEYIDFKTLPDTDKLDAIDHVCNSIREGEEKVYLLDEITYSYNPELEINKISEMFSETSNSSTHVVFTGSQSIAIESWAHRAFGGNAAFIRSDFLKYNEWLKYTHLDNNEDSYEKFLLEVADFYNFTSLKDYLAGCIDETLVSNLKTTNAVWGNNVYLIKDDIDSLLDICYTSLFSLHNHITYQNLTRESQLTSKIRFYFREACKELGDSSIGERIANSFVGHYDSFRTKDLALLKQGFLFLYQCGIISITPVTDNLDSFTDILRDFKSEDSKINYKDELFAKYNICFRYPMFYVRILQDILGEHFPEKLPAALVGSIVECHVRGLLPDSGCIEYQNSEHKEIDYVDIRECIAIEFSISDKKSNEYNFGSLPDYYRCLSLTKTIKSEHKRMLKLPYFEFIKIASESISLTQNSLDLMNKTQDLIARSNGGR